MEKELLIELNGIRKELGIPMEDFLVILAKAKMRRDRSPLSISDEMLYEIVLDAFSSYDYDNYDYEEEKKGITIDTLRALIAGEKQERKLSDDVLFSLIEDSLDTLQEYENGKKTTDELVDRAAKSLGI